MKKVLMTILLSTTVISGAQAQDYGVRESTAWFGELLHKWETTNSSSYSSVRQELTDGAYNAQGIEGTGHKATYGWCNEAVVWAMDQVGMFENAEDKHEGFAQMRGRHWATDYNDKVTQSFNHDEEFDWDNVPIGTVALMDFANSPSEWTNLGIDHVSTFMGKVDDEWGWFLGGNQKGNKSGHLQPKLYRLDHMTHGSIFSEQGADVKKHYYDNVEVMARIKIEDGTWEKSNVSGWGYGKNRPAKWNQGGPANSFLMSKQWNQLGPTIQKFESGENVVYVQTNEVMEVYEGQIIRTADYFDHVEINKMKDHIGDDVMMSREIQRDHDWWSSRTDKSFDSFKDELGTAGSQWHDRVLTATAINEALETQWDRTFDSVFSNGHRDIEGAATEFVALFNNDDEAKAEHYDYTLARELYVEYGVEYYDEDETLMSNHFETQ